MRYRLGLDLGANSLGWAVLELDEAGLPFRVVRLGVRVFPDGRVAGGLNMPSLAAERREKRAMRRRRDRWLRRMNQFREALVRHGLLPKESDAQARLLALDPYQLRAEALDRPLDTTEIGRALWHLAKRRGFRSNRRIDRAQADESGKIKSAISHTRRAIAESNCRTVGEWLAHRRAQGASVRARLRGRGAQAAFELYLDRDLIRAEFDAIWAAQAAHHPRTLTDDARHELLERIVMFQRKLHKKEAGPCSLAPDHPRAALAMPSVQRFRIHQEVASLAWMDSTWRVTPLTVSQRQSLAQELIKGRTLTFDQIRRLLKLGDARFNLEDEKRDRLKGDATAAALGKRTLLGDKWHTLDRATQDRIVQLLLDEEDEARVMAGLQASLGIDASLAEQVSNVGLPAGYGRLSMYSLEKILPHLASGTMLYSDAVVAAGFASHSDLSDKVVRDKLPYYGEVLQRHTSGPMTSSKVPAEHRWGRISNPTVHIGLNQLRKVVNTLIERYGAPAEVFVEVARELKQTREARERTTAEQAARQRVNDRLRTELQECGLPTTSDNMVRLRLYEEMRQADPTRVVCVYTGRHISASMALSPEVEVDHILPFSRTLDDSMPNKLLVTRQANRAKGNRTPFEAFSASPTVDGVIFNWNEISERANALPGRRGRRFAEDAVEDFLKGSNFLARHLNDTAYLSRVAREYLQVICPADKVAVSPGRVTGLIRGRWGLNSILSVDSYKNRSDHRHHAIDAVVVAMSDRRVLQALSNASSRAGALGVSRLLESFDLPWPTFRQELEQHLRRMTVSYKPDHAPEARLHNETAYGLTGQVNEAGVPIVVHRIGIEAIVSRSDIEKIRDTRLRDDLSEAVGNTSGKEFAARVSAWSHQREVRRIRITEPLTVIEIQGRNSRNAHAAYKAYKGDSNYCQATSGVNPLATSGTDPRQG